MLSICGMLRPFGDVESLYSQIKNYFYRIPERVGPEMTRSITNGYLKHYTSGDPYDGKSSREKSCLRNPRKSDPNHWNYCRGKTNPADKLTRGLSIYALVKDEVWWRGPDWLCLVRNLQCDTSHNEINAVGSNLMN
ncbi:uncharacterized protein TNIN_100261 [Trichonephila inaurata madagascariensis]|uniref:Uncharacterized protein n=1 Tax=Trichonephila inaurata madagascariensis TaxID=2747483 RepID=A0A8X7BUU4_9ARAC|nr:uncharacterized protein TNIN_100261 [Trichonephila inaurata madagascariensis]